MIIRRNTAYSNGTANKLPPPYVDERDPAVATDDDNDDDDRFEPNGAAEVSSSAGATRRVARPNSHLCVCAVWTREKKGPRVA